MKYSLYWEGDTRSAGRDISGILWNLELRPVVQNSPPIFPVLSAINLERAHAHTHTHIPLRKIHFNARRQSCCKKWPLKFPLYRPWRFEGRVDAQLYSFFNLGARLEWVVNTMPLPLHVREKDTVRIVREAGWAPGPVWTGTENLVPTGIRYPDRPTCSESLYRLSYRGPRKVTISLVTSVCLQSVHTEQRDLH